MAFSIIGSIFSAVLMITAVTTAILLSRYEVNLPVLFRSTVFYVNDFLFWETPENCYCPILVTQTTHPILTYQNISLRRYFVLMWCEIIKITKGSHMTCNSFIHSKGGNEIQIQSLKWPIILKWSYMRIEADYIIV